MIGLATAHRVFNYGTKLQAFAMQQIMAKRGFDFEILQYNQTNQPRLLLFIKHVIISIIGKIYDRKKHNIVQKVGNQYKDVSLTVKGNIIKRFLSIESFDKRLKIKAFYGNSLSLKKYSTRYSAVFCGSDQAWLPSNVKYNFYTLAFASDNVRRISYAPSFGISRIPIELISKYQYFLSHIDFISVREQQGKELVKELVNKDVPVVLDPTLLVGRTLWDQIIDEKQARKEGNYIFVYLLGNSIEHRNICEYISQRTNYKILSMPHFKTYNVSDENLSGKHLYSVTPEEFIGYIRNAKYVITDSFHCSAFAIQYHVPFFTLERYSNNSIESTNSRIKSLLCMFDLSQRLLQTFEKNRIEELLKDNIDFCKTENILCQKQTESDLFLDNAMQDLK